jgi:hypothetical protein
VVLLAAFIAAGVLIFGGRASAPRPHEIGKTQVTAVFDTPLTGTYQLDVVVEKRSRRCADAARDHQLRGHVTTTSEREAALKSARLSSLLPAIRAGRSP